MRARNVDSRDVTTAAPPHRWIVFLVATVAFFAPMAVWAFASPLSSIPDEPAHFIRAAAVVDGQIVTGVWEENPAFAGVEVPRYVAHTASLTCFAFQPEVTADCAPELEGDPDEPVITGTSAALNSPVYYAVVGLPTLIAGGDVALYGMRLVNALVTAALLGIAAMQLSRIRPMRWTLVALAAATTPMVVYLAGSVNPNAWEAAGAAALMSTLLAAFLARGPSRERWEQVGLVFVAVALLVNTRSIAFLWVVLIVALVLALVGAERVKATFATPQAWAAVGAAALAGILSLVWYAFLPDYDETAIPVAGMSMLGAFIVMFFSTVEQAEGLIGFFGWLDTPSPALGAALLSAILIAGVVAALILGRTRHRVALLSAVAVLVVLPAVVQAVIAPSLGLIWQGRYTLALFVAVVLAAGFILDRDAGTAGGAHGRPVVVVVLTGVVVAQMSAFFWVLKRYAVGITGSWRDLLLEPSWQPPGGMALLAIVLALALTAGGLLVIHATRGDESRPEPAPGASVGSATA